MSYFSEPTNAAKNKTLFCKDLSPSLKNTFGAISKNQNFKSKQLCKKPNCIIGKRTHYSSKFLLNLRFSPNPSASFQNNNCLILKKGFKIFVDSCKAKDSTIHKKHSPPISGKIKKFQKDVPLNEEKNHTNSVNNQISAPTSPKGIAIIPAGGGEGKVPGNVRHKGISGGGVGRTLANQIPKGRKCTTDITSSFCLGTAMSVEKQYHNLPEGSGAVTLNYHTPKQAISNDHTFCVVSQSRSLKGIINDHSYCRKDGPKKSLKVSKKLKSAKNTKVIKSYDATSETAAVKPKSYCADCQTPILGVLNDHTYSKNVVPKIVLQNPVPNVNLTDFGKLKILSLNVNGLKGKLISDDLEQEISNHDIICLSEVKMDSCDVGVLKSDFGHFTIFTNIEDEYKVNPRGGIIIFVKNYLCNSVKFLDKCKILVSIEINSEILRGGKI